MLDFPRWKVTSILVLLAAADDAGDPRASSRKKYTQSPGCRGSPSASISPAASTCCYEADTDAFLATRLDNMSQQIVEHAQAERRGSISATYRRRTARLSFLVRDVTQIDAVRERLLAVAGSGAGLTGQRVWDISVVDATRFVGHARPRLAVTQAVNQAMDDTTENIRRRIDALGTESRRSSARAATGSWSRCRACRIRNS